MAGINIKTFDFSPEKIKEILDKSKDEVKGIGEYIASQGSDDKSDNDKSDIDKSDNDKSDNDKTDNKQIFGQMKNGDYITPYNITIFYHQNSLFESAVAALSNQAQLIPLSKDADLDIIGEVCEFVSLEVLVFGNDLSREHINKILDRGFKFVHIYTSDIKYLDEDKPYRKEIATFGINEIYDHFILKPGLFVPLILDYIICGEFNRVSSFDNTFIDCKSFCNRIKSLGFNYVKKINELNALGYKGYEQVNKYIVEEKAMQELREKTINSNISNGVVQQIQDNRIYFIFDSTYYYDLRQLIPIHPKINKRNIDFVCIAEIIKAPQQYYDKFVNSFSQKDDTVEKIEVGEQLPQACGDIIGWNFDIIKLTNKDFPGKLSGQHNFVPFGANLIEDLLFQMREPNETISDA